MIVFVCHNFKRMDVYEGSTKPNFLKMKILFYKTIYTLLITDNPQNISCREVCICRRVDLNSSFTFKSHDKAFLFFAHFRFV